MSLRSKRSGIEMQCPQCQRETPESADFCTHCGARTQVRCQRCNALNPPESNFCRSCGATVGAEERGTPSQEAASPFAQACPRCRAVNEPGAVYCFRCGLPLEGATRVPSPSSVAGEPGGFWVRFVAYVVDGIILLVVGIIPAAAVGEVSLLLDALYFTVAVAVWRTTIGKHLFRLYVVRADGSRVGFGRAFARWLAYIPSGLILFIGFIMIGLREDKRGLHDLICDTRVIRR